MAFRQQNSLYFCLLMLLVSTTGLLMDPKCFVQPPCTCLRDIIDCEHMSLDFIPIIDPVDWTGPFLGLHFGGNNISTVEDDSFFNINITSISDISIYLENNAISSIADDAFNGVESNVYSINLTNNELISIPRAFANLTKLGGLYLNGNPIKILDSYTMNRIGMKLNALEINMSKFKRWPAEFRYLRRISSLSLFQIPFYNLHYDAFQGMEHSLVYLSLVDTNFDQLPLALCRLLRLGKLYFEHNSHLIDNKVFVETCLADLVDQSKYIRLSFRNNSLVEFPVILHNLSAYYLVDFGNNNIEFIKEDTIPSCNITKLVLDHNKFSRIPYALNNLKMLKELDLSHNNIGMIGEPDLENTAMLETLILHNNDLMFVNSRAFSNNAYLKNIDLSNNKLKTVPGAIGQSQALTNIDLSGNTIDCTCLEFDTISWRISSMTIKGFCEYGTESLQSFLSIVTARCP